MLVYVYLFAPFHFKPVKPQITSVATHIEGYDNLISDFEVTGNLLFKEEIEYKTLLGTNNSISITNNNHEKRQITITIIDKTGKNVFHDEVSESKKYTFKGEEGEGTVKIQLSRGQHDFVIKVKREYE